MKKNPGIRFCLLGVLGALGGSNRLCLNRYRYFQILESPVNCKTCLGPLFSKGMDVDLKSIWEKHYSAAPGQLEKMKGVKGVASVFNVNIDAVLKVKPEMLLRWMSLLNLDAKRLLAAGDKKIMKPADILRGFVACFSKGIAQEWMVFNAETFLWMRDHLGQDRNQMGGQGGIIANVMAVCGVQNTYVHCASLPAGQSALFLDQPNLLSTDPQGKLSRAAAINRSGDLPLIHWILEFDKGDQLTLDGTTATCPKSNRFIATYDPLNFKLHLDESFSRALREGFHPLDYILLSGYQVLSEPMQGGGSGIERIGQSWKEIEAWKGAHPGCKVHLEFASTQDAAIRKAVAEKLAPRADSLGCNEQEEIDLLAVMGEEDLSRECARSMDSVSLFKGLLKLFQKLKPGRAQLHMFGLYVTLAREDWGQSDSQIRDGMVFAATLAAAKAGTGSLEKEENLLWARGRQVADHSLKELGALSAYLEKTYGLQYFESSGIGRAAGFRIIAVPTILIEKPVTLIGMGDTISSLSLVGAL
jgi:ADP-dependent phosphofructokinase/glucokinase